MANLANTFPYAGPHVERQRPENEGTYEVRRREATDDDGAALNFPHILAERQIPSKESGAGGPTAKSAPVPDQEQAPGAADASVTDSRNPETVAESQSAKWSATPAVSGLVSGTESAPSLPSAGVDNALPAVLAQGLAVRRQMAVNMDSVGATTNADAKPMAPGTAGLAQAGQTSPVKTASGQTPAIQHPVAQTLSGPATTAQPHTETMPAANEPVAPATPNAEGPAAAITLQATAKGRQSYTPTPVVSESQIVADSLKSEAKIHDPGHKSAADPSPVAATGEAITPAPDTATGQGAEGENRDAPLPDQAAATEGAAVQTKDIQVSATESSEQAVAAEAAETALAAADPVSATRPSGSGGPASATQAAIGNAVARDIRAQVVRHVTNHVRDITGQEKVVIKLNPESLGQIELNFESREDRLSVVISASSPEAEVALRENLKDLTDRIVERSARFSHVDVRVEVKEGADSRSDNKQDQKQDGRQDQRRENGEQDRDQNPDQQHGRQAQQARQAWETAMSWQLADDAVNEEG